jgi:hypothetical protein
MEKLHGITGEVYVQSEEPKNAGEGAVWFNFDGTDLDSIDGAAADWEAKELETGFIKNKPFEKIEYPSGNLKKIVFDSEKTY